MRNLISSWCAVAALALFGCATPRAAQTPAASAPAPTTAAKSGSGDSCPLPAANPSSDDAAKPVVAQGLAKVGDRTTCPVSGETFVVKADSSHVEYQGKTYYFCCDHCVEQFQANPAKYLHAG